MDWQIIPDNQQRVTHLLAQGRQERNDLRPLGGSVEEVKVEAPEADAGNHRQQFPAEAVLQNRCLTSGHPGFHASSAFRASGLVDKDERASLLPGVF
jgi:hypothetical protein